MLLMSMALAEEPTYANLKKGDPAPFDGRLFSPAAVAQVITEHRLKDLDCDLEVEYRLDKAGTEAQYTYDILETTCKAEAQKLRDINIIREEELSILRASNKPLRPYIWMTGGFIMGTATSIAIFKTVSND